MIFCCRRVMIEKIASHIADFSPRLQSNTRALYQYCPIPVVNYPQLEHELFCNIYYLKHLCDTQKFPDWPIKDPVCIHCLQCITVNILHLSVYSIKRFWWNAAYADLSTVLNTMQTCQFKKMPIQIHVNSIKNYFLLIIVHAKCKKFAVSCNYKLFFNPLTTLEPF